MKYNDVYVPRDINNPVSKHETIYLCVFKWSSQCFFKRTELNMAMDFCLSPFCTRKTWAQFLCQSQTALS